ncbi:MAG: putative sulfate/molybdate transporter [Kiloniellales bacterium]
MSEGQSPTTEKAAKRARWRRWSGELGGACGDLGTLLPHALAAIAVVGLAPAGVLLGFGVFLIATGAFYVLPIAVQPMKAVSAVMLTSGLGPGEIAATGLILGAIFLLLGATGAITRLARIVPQSVTTGLQLGLGISMGLIGLSLMTETPWLGGAILVMVLLLLRVPQCPAALLALVAAFALGQLFDLGGPLPALSIGLHLPPLAVPSWDEAWRALELAVLPQLALTLTNAVIVTAALARDLFPERAARASERNLALSTGIANLTLAPFGALPMCHGAGGLQAQARFGATRGGAPILLGCLLLALGLLFAPEAAAILAAIPAAAVGALLIFAGLDLAISKRLFDARPACWHVIALTAVLAVVANPAIALAAGWGVELLQRPLADLVRRFSARRGS